MSESPTLALRPTWQAAGRPLRTGHTASQLDKGRSKGGRAVARRGARRQAAGRQAGRARSLARACRAAMTVWSARLRGAAHATRCRRLNARVGFQMHGRWDCITLDALAPNSALRRRPLRLRLTLRPSYSNNTKSWSTLGRIRPNLKKPSDCGKRSMTASASLKSAALK